MKVTGFTIARNVVKFDYPIVESIQSILPICDEFVVFVGESEDNTLEYIKSIDSPKIKIFYSVWNETLKDGGKVLAVETNKAFQSIGPETDWCFYIQADELVHEQDLEHIKHEMHTYQNNDKVDGLLFKYYHFYHSYHYINKSSRFYRNEIRIIKNNKNIYSYIDAQGFRKLENKKLNVIPIDAFIYHYGWARPPKPMRLKQKSIMKYYHSESDIDKDLGSGEEFDYSKYNYLLEKFTKTHPRIMQKRISEMNWPFDVQNYRTQPTIKEAVKGILKKHMGIDLSFTNYKIIKS